MSMRFVTAVWWIKALSARTVTPNKSQVNRLSYRDTANGRMKTVNPSGHKVINYCCCNVANKEECLTQLLRHNLFFCWKSQPGLMLLSIKRTVCILSIFYHFTIQSQTFSKHCLALDKDNEEKFTKFHCIRTIQFTFCQLAHIFLS